MVCSRTIFQNTLCYEMNTKIWCYYKARCSWYFIDIHFVCKNLNALCADYLLIFWHLLTFFFATFSQKQASNDHLTKGNLLKWTLLNEKQNICGLHGAVTFRSVLWVILWTFIRHTILFAVKESCHGNLVIDGWLSYKWNNVRPLLVESLVIVIFKWFF